MKRLTSILLLTCFFLGSFVIDLAAQDITTGLVAYYSFNGDANDVSGNGNDGTVNGATLTTDRFGNANRAYSFDGSNDLISIAHNASLVPADEITISMWVKATNIQSTSFSRLYNKEDIERHLLSFQANGTILAFGLFINGSYSELDVGIVPTDFENVWVHVAAVYDGSFMRIYMNGLEIGNILASGSLGTSNTSDVTIGSANGGGEYYNGLIDEIGIYNRALSQSEILQLGDVPIITSFTPTSGPVGTSVTITGTNFDATPANNIVFFGATQATVSASTAIELTVTVPTGGTYQPITVLVNELMAYSDAPFVVTFANDGTGIDASSFAANIDFSTGTSPVSVSVSDLDGDGMADLVVENQIDDNLSVFRNTSVSPGSISFATKVDINTGTSPRSVSISDLDGDGQPDIVLVNEDDNTLSIFRNTSSGAGVISFETKVDITTGTGPYSVSIGDLDKDGKADLAVVNYGSSTLSVLRNISTGAGNIGFAPSVDFITDGWPTAVSNGDLDGDGKKDLAVASKANNTVSVFRNTSTGKGSINFATKVDFTAELRPESVSIGDLDADGKADLAVANEGSNTISTFRNTSTGPGVISFATREDFATGSSPVLAAISDVDGDGKVDLTIPNFMSSTISVFRNTSTGAGTISFDNRVDFITGLQPGSVSIGDLDGDGGPDLAVANFNSSTVSVFRNTMVLNSETDFESFSFPEQTGVAAIGAGTIDIEVAYDADLTNLVATFDLSSGATVEIVSTPQISGITTNDFSTTVTYTVTAEDGVTTQDWVVTVAVAPSIETDIIVFTIPEQVDLSNIDAVNHTISLEIINGTDITGLTPNIIVSPGATISPLSDEVQDFTNPVTYTVLAEDGTTPENWQVTVTMNTTMETGTLSDIDGNVYKTVKIGNQWWMAENLKTTRYAEGTTLIDGASTGDISGDYTTNYYFAPGGDAANVGIYGYLYTWPAAMKGSSSSMAKGACPDAWHIPSDFEWQELEMNVGLNPADADAIGVRGPGGGGALKEVGFAHWTMPNSGATNEVGFRILPAGTRNANNSFDSFGDVANIWTSWDASISQAFSREFFYDTDMIGRFAPEKDIALSVRCVKDRSSATDILSFSLSDQTGSATINAVNKRVDIEVFYGTDVLSLIPTFTLSVGATSTVNAIAQVSGVTANDYTNLVTYTVTAEDGVTTQEWEVTVTEQQDITNPIISDQVLPTVIMSGSTGEETSITVTDNSSISAVTFYFKLSNAAEFTGIILNSSNDKYEYIITENLVTDIGLDYFLLAEDGNANVSSTDTAKIVIQYNADNGPTIPNLSSGGEFENWRMFSIPFVLDNKNIATVFEEPLGTYDDTKWRLVHYKNDEEQFVEYKNGLGIVERGKGYWFNSVELATIPMSPGKSPPNNRTNLATLILQSGWNQIGNPYTFDVSWNEIMAYNGIGNEVEDNLRVFENGTNLTNSAVLMAFGGAYVMANQDITLEVPMVANTGGRTKKVNDFSQGWLLGLNLKAGIFSNSVSGLGMHPDALLTNDHFDQIRAPRFAKYIDATFDHPEYFVPNFSRDIVPEQENYFWEFAISTNVDEEIKTVTWNIPEIGENQNLILIDQENGNVINMMVNTQYSFAEDKTRRFKVVIGDEAYLIQQLNGNKAYLGFNYPNPFDQNTTIPYFIHGEEGDYKVVINIYSIDGRLVKSLVNKELSPGIYSTEWDGKESSGIKLVGMFIYSLEVQTSNGVQSFRKKMIVR